MLPPRLAGGPPGDRARLQALARAPGVTGRSGPYPVAAAVLRARGYTVGVMPEGPDRYPAARCRCARPGRPEQEAELADAVGMALLVVLDKLSPPC